MGAAGPALPAALVLLPECQCGGADQRPHASTKHAAAAQPHCANTAWVVGLWCQILLLFPNSLGTQCVGVGDTSAGHSV